MSIKSDFLELNKLTTVHDTQPRECWKQFLHCLLRRRLFRYLKWHLERKPFNLLNSKEWINKFNRSDQKIELYVSYDEQEFVYDPILQIKDKTGYIIAEFEVIVDHPQSQETKRSESYSCNVAVAQNTKEVYPEQISVRVEGIN